MRAILRLFKAVEIKFHNQENPNELLLGKTIPLGFIFSPEVVGNYSYQELFDMVTVISADIGLSAEQMNSSFHKSWNKVKTASIEQLFVEQIIHYFTTYGFEALGIYDKDSVYIPNEALEIPELSDNISLTIIKGYTKAELKEKLLSLLNSGIALGEDTIKDVLDIATYIELNAEDIDNTKNKEVKIALYDYLDLFPENPIEFLRYAVYKSTDRTLLIKDNATLEEIKSKKNLNVLALFLKYEKKYGLEKLAQIFLRFKPIFLAFRTNTRMNKITNKIRKLAKTYHKPMPEDYLNEITAKIKKRIIISPDKLQIELDKVNTFRKIRLAYALKFRTKDVNSILYRIRNGKGYATDFYFGKSGVAKEILKTVIDSISKDIEINVKGKKIYIPDNIIYALPATEKMFTGNFPSGTYVSVPKDMVVGIYWKNVNGHRIDIDLSMINENRKMGWDSSYRTEGGDILFSGDVTDAPKGASEFYFVKRQKMDANIVIANYYNYKADIPVPMKIIVAKEEAKNIKANYMVNPNNIVAVANTKIDKHQKILGLLITQTNGSRFYFAETNLGRSITSFGSIFVKHSRQYLLDFYRNTISLNDILENLDCELVKDKNECDIDLSPENLEKDTIINLILKP